MIGNFKIVSSYKIKSNVDGKDIEPLFDYGDITERDKSVIQEVITLIGQRPGVPGDMIAAELKEKFKLVEVPMMKVEETVWHQLTKDEKIGASMQGFRETNDENGNKIRIPHIGFSADLDYLEGFINRLANKLESIPKANDK